MQFGIFDLKPENGMFFYFQGKERPHQKSQHMFGILVENASGFVYYVSVRGITGTRSATVDEIAQNVARIRKQTDLSVAVGFGIRTPQQAAEVATVADAAVVGSAIVEHVAAGLDDNGKPSANLVSDALAFVADLSAAVRTARQDAAS